MQFVALPALPQYFATKVLLVVSPLLEIFVLIEIALVIVGDDPPGYDERCPGNSG